MGMEVIKNLPGIAKESTICGVSYKEDTTLARLNNLGFENTWRIDMNKDLGISDKKANLESIQHYLKPGIVNSIHNKYGIPDLIIVRHILEHTCCMTCAKNNDIIVILFKIFQKFFYRILFFY